MAVAAGVVRYTRHSLEQMKVRGFKIADVERVLRNGFHDEGRDMIASFGKWRYRIQGRTVDGAEIRLAVEIEDEVVVVTVID